MNPARKPRFYLAKSIATLLAGYFALDLHGSAAPRVQQVVSGSASFNVHGRNLTIDVSNQAIINYYSFNIGRGETVTFVQPNSSSTVLNRVTTASPSYIFGMLQANGQVYIVNPSGIFFENGSVINVGGLFAAAGHMSDQDFLSGKNLFTDLSAAVVNRGTITSAGDVGLFGSSVSNFGTITAPNGVVAMIAGDHVLYGEKGSNIFVNAGPAATTTSTSGSGATASTTHGGKTAGANTHGAKTGTATTTHGSVTTVSATASGQAGVQNAGTIRAQQAFLGAGDMYAVAIINSGTITSPNITLQGGRNSQVSVSGTLDASAKAPGQVGGTIKVLGGKVSLRDANLDASGAAGGGEILVGGDTHGGNGVQTSSTTTVDAATTIKADALTSGNGGKVVVWSDVYTDFEGSISARGAGLGAGGSAEVSSKSLLNFNGKVDLTAPSGQTGSLLLDPSQITISTGGNSNISGSSPFTSTSNTPAGNTMSTLNITTLQNALAGASVVVDATGGTGVQSSPSITVANAVSWGTASTLTLTAGAGGIAINAAITAATGGLTLNSGAGITETGGSVAVATLTTNSATGQTLTGANTVGSFNATNTTSGNIALTNTATTLTISGLSQAGNGTVTVNNTGALTTTGTVTTTGTGSMTLQASGTETIGANVTASAGPGTIILTSTGGNLALNANVNAGTGGVALSAATGTITQAGGKTVTAGALGLAATATPTLLTSGTLSTLAVDITGAANPFTFSQAATFDVGTVGGISGVTTNNGTISLTASSGNLTMSQNVNAGTAAVNLTASNGAITETTGAISGALLTTNSATGQALSDANTVTSFNATNSTSGNIALTNTATTLTVTGVSQSGTGTVTVNNTGALTTTGTVTTTGTGLVTLQSSGTETIGANVTASAGPGGIELISTGGNLALNANVNAGTGPVEVSAANGTISQTGGKSITAGSLGIAAMATPSLVLTGTVGTIAADITGSGNPFTFSQAAPFIVGTVGTISGVTTDNGAITLTASSGNLTISQNVSAGTAAVHLSSTLGSILENATVSGGSAIFTASTTVLGFEGTAVNTTGSQTYTGAVVLAADTALTASSTGGITFDSTVNSNQNAGVSNLWTLTVTDSATTTFDGAVGAVGTELGALTINAGGTTDLNGGTVLTKMGGGALQTGSQIYSDAVQLGAATTLTSTGGGAITFGSTVNGAFALGVNAAGVATFDGAVGGTTPLASLNVAATEIDLNGSTVTTSGGSQVYNGPVVLTADTTLTASVSGNITFDSTVNSQASDLWTLTLSSNGVTSFGGDVGTATNGQLGALTINYNGAVGLPSELTQLGNGAGTVHYPGSPETGSTITIDTMSDGVPASIRTGAQSYGEDVTLLADATLNAGHGTTTLPFASPVAAVTFSRTVNSGASSLWTLTLNADGVTSFDGDVGTSSPLGALTVNYNAAIGLPSELTQLGNGAGTVHYPGSPETGSTITIDTTSDGVPASIRTGAQSYGEDVTLLADATLNAGHGTTTLPFASPIAAVTFSRTVNSGAGSLWTLTLNADGVTSFDGDVGTSSPLGALTVNYNAAIGLPSELTQLGNGAGTVHYPGSPETGSTITIDTMSNGVPASIRTGAQSYGEDVTLLADATLNASRGTTTLPFASPIAAVTFSRTVNSGASSLWTLTLNADGVTSFDGDVGTSSPLGALTVGYNAAIGLPSELTQLGNGAATAHYPGSPETGSTITIDTMSDGVAASIRTGAQSYGEDVTLLADATLNAGHGTTTLPFASPVAAVTFGRTVNSGASSLWTLTLNADGVTSFDGDVGTSSPLGALTVGYNAAIGLPSELTQLGNGAGTVHYPGSPETGSTITIDTTSDGVPASIRTGAQSYGTDVTLLADATLNASRGTTTLPFVSPVAAVTFGRTVNSGASSLWTLTLNADGVTSFDGDVGTSSPLGALTVNYNAAIGLPSELTQLGNGAATAHYPGSPETGSTITIDTMSDGVAASIRTGAQSYGEDVTLLADATLNAGHGTTTLPFASPIAAVTFSRTVNSGASSLWTLTLNADGVTSFDGDVGTSSPLGALTVGYNAAIGLPSELTQLGNGAGTVHYPGSPETGSTITIDTTSDGVPASIRTGAQSYGEDVTLLADATLNAGHGTTTLPFVSPVAAVTFGRTLNSGASSLWTLTLNADGVTSFDGDVGTSSPLGALTVNYNAVVGLPSELTQLGNGAGTVHYPGSPETGSTITIDTMSDGVPASIRTGAQSYGEDVTLLADATLNASHGTTTLPFVSPVAAVTFGRTVNSGASSLWTLTLNADGVTSFDGDVGTSSPLGALTVNYNAAIGLPSELTQLGNGAATAHYPGSPETGSTITIDTMSDGVAASIRTGAQSYGEDVTLLADATLNASRGTTTLPFVSPVAAVTFSRTVNSGASSLWTLAVNADGVTSFDGDVGTSSPLGALTVGYNAAIGLPSELTQLGNGAGTVHYPGSPETGSTITIDTMSDGVPASIRTGAQSYGTDVTLLADATFNASRGTTTLPFVSPVAAVTFGRTLNSGASSLWTVTVNADGVTSFDGDVGTATNGQLGALTVNYNAVVGLPSELTQLGNGAATAHYPGSAETGSTITIDTKSDGMVASIRTGTQTYGDDVFVNADATLIADHGSYTAPLPFTPPPSLTAVAAVTFERTVNANASTLSTLNVEADGRITFDGDVGTATNGALGALTTGSFNAPLGLPSQLTVLGNEGSTVHYPGTGLTGSTIAVNTENSGVAASTHNGNQTYNDDVELWADATLLAQSQTAFATQPNITFNQLVDSHVATSTVHNLTAISYGNEIFNGVVGGRLTLGNLVTDQAPQGLGVKGITGGAAEFNMTAPGLVNPAGVTAYSVTTYDNFVDFNVTGSTTTTPSVQTSVGGQTYYSQGMLMQNTILVANGTQNVIFSNPNLSGAGATQTILAVDASADGFTPALGTTAPAGMVQLTVTAGELVEFNGAVGGAGELGMLTTNAGTTEFNTPTQTIYTTLPYQNPATTIQPPLVFPSQANPASVPPWHSAWVNVAGNVTVNGSVVFNVPNSSSANQTVETQYGAQRYYGPAILQQNTYVKSDTVGDILFNSTITGPYTLVIDAAGAARLNGNVTIAELDVTGEQGIDLAALGPITITTTGSQTYYDDVNLESNVTMISSTGKAITFKEHTDGPGGLTVNTTGGTVTFVGDVGDTIPLAMLKVSAANIIVANVTASGNASLDATTLLQLLGTKYKAGSTLSFNPTARAASGSASIIKATGNLTLDANAFIMGLQQKLLVDSGSLTIDAGSASVGDLAASSSMTLDIGSLTVLGRPPGGFVNANRQDQGVSFVSPTITFNGTLVAVSPSGSVNFGTLTGLVLGSNNLFTVPGVNLLKQTDLSNQFGHASLPNTFLQPIAGGLITTSNEGANPLLPIVFDLPQPFLYESDPQISLALIQELIALGINAREPTEEETLSINIREGVFNQPQDLIEPEDTGYEVVVNRITKEEAKRVAKYFEEIGGVKGLAAIQQNLDSAVTKYFSDTKAENVDADKFVSWLQQKAGSTPEAAQGLAQLKVLARLFNEIQSMGLTDAEVSRSKGKIIEKINLTSPLPKGDLEKAVQKLQSTAPKPTIEASKKKGPNQAAVDAAVAAPVHG